MQILNDLILLPRTSRNANSSWIESLKGCLYVVIVTKTTTVYLVAIFLILESGGDFYWSRVDRVEEREKASWNKIEILNLQI